MTTRLYYADSFLAEFEANVTEIQELSRKDGRSLWRVALDRSAFYPTSGGQPHDTGTLIATARSGAELTAEIVEVEEDERGEVWHHTAKPLASGTLVRGAVDQTRRLDHMQQHSGQHLLSAAFFQIAGAPTVSYHLGEQVSTIDLAIEKLSAETIEEAELLANRIIAEDRPVTAAIVPRAQAEAWLADGTMRKLPARAGDLRILEIAGEDPGAPFDRNACGGTHVRSTGQIGGLHVRGVEKVREGWRVKFVCGLRAMQSARSDFRTLGETGRQLSTSFAEIPQAILRLQSEAKQTAKRIQALAINLAAFRAARLIRETPVENGFRVVVRRLDSTQAATAAEAKLLASKIVVQAKNTAAILTWAPVNSWEPATVILAHSGDLDFDCATTLRQLLGERNARGGGSKEMAQGALSQEHLPWAIEQLAAKIKSATAASFSKWDCRAVRKLPEP